MSDERSGDAGEGPPPPSPLTGAYLLIVLPQLHSLQHKDRLIHALTKGLITWDAGDCHVDLDKELSNITSQAPEGEEAKNGERLIQFASENLVTEVLIHPQLNTLVQCMRNCLSSFTRHRHIVHAGYTSSGNGAWVLQDGTYSFSDFADMYSEHEVQRVLRAYEGTVSVDVHCSGEGDWWALKAKDPFSKVSRVRLNPPDKTSTTAAVRDFLKYLSQYLVPADLTGILESSDVVGNIRFSHPTLYVFPGGQGDAALFGINGFNMLVDGGFSRKSCFWDFTRHLDRLDSVLMTRINNGNLQGLASLLRRKKGDQVYPQIGHFFSNIPDRKQVLSPDGDKDRDPLLINLIEEGQEMLTGLRHLGLKPQACYRDPSIEPINLYHKVGHGKLDMYVLSPAKDSREVREFLAKWAAVDSKIFCSYSRKGEFNFPLSSKTSICALLVWQPANPEDNITRLLFPGSTPQQKIFEGLDKLKNLEFMKHPVCSAKSLSPSSSTVKLSLKAAPPKSTLIEKVAENEKKQAETVKAVKQEVKKATLPPKPKPKIDRPKDKTEKPKTDLETKQETVKIDKKSSEAVQKVEKEIKKEKPKRTVQKPPEKKTQKPPEKKADSVKSSPTTPKKTVENKLSEMAKPEPKPETKTRASRVKASPTATPAKSAKEANNRKVVELKSHETSKLQAQRGHPPKKDEPKKIERPVSKKPSASPKDGKSLSPVKAAKPGGKQKLDVKKAGKPEKDITTDSSAVSTPSTVDAELTKAKEDAEKIKEVEDSKQEDLEISRKESEDRGKSISKEEDEEILIIEKVEISNEVTGKSDVETIAVHLQKADEEKKKALKVELKEEAKVTLIPEKEKDDISLPLETKQVAQEEVQEIIETATEIVSKKLDMQKTESQEISGKDLGSTDRIVTPKEKELKSVDVEQRIDESQPDEKFSTTVESGATTTAPTLPEDERIPLDEIKEGVEEKHVKEETKEKEIITMPRPEQPTSLPQVPVIAGTIFDQRAQRLKDIVKTPDEVADLPVHEEADIGIYEGERPEELLSLPASKRDRKEETTEELKLFKDNLEKEDKSKDLKEDMVDSVDMLSHTTTDIDLVSSSPKSGKPLESDEKDEDIQEEATKGDIVPPKEVVTSTEILKPDEKDEGKEDLLDEGELHKMEEIDKHSVKDAKATVDSAETITKEKVKLGLEETKEQQITDLKFEKVEETQVDSKVKSIIEEEKIKESSDEKQEIEDSKELKVQEKEEPKESGTTTMDDKEFIDIEKIKEVHVSEQKTAVQESEEIDKTLIEKEKEKIDAKSLVVESEQGIISISDEYKKEEKKDKIKTSEIPEKIDKVEDEIPIGKVSPTLEEMLKKEPAQLSEIEQLERVLSPKERSSEISPEQKHEEQKHEDIKFEEEVSGKTSPTKDTIDISKSKDHEKIVTEATIEDREKEVLGVSAVEKEIDILNKEEEALGKKSPPLEIEEAKKLSIKEEIKQVLQTESTNELQDSKLKEPTYINGLITEDVEERELLKDDSDMLLKGSPKLDERLKPISDHEKDAIEDEHKFEEPISKEATEEDDLEISVEEKDQKETTEKQKDLKPGLKEEITDLKHEEFTTEIEEKLKAETEESIKTEIQETVEEMTVDEKQKEDHKAKEVKEEEKIVATVKEIETKIESSELVTEKPKSSLTEEPVELETKEISPVKPKELQSDKTLLSKEETVHKQYDEEVIKEGDVVVNGFLKDSSEEKIEEYQTMTEVKAKISTETSESIKELTSTSQDVGVLEQEESKSPDQITEKKLTEEEPDLSFGKEQIESKEDILSKTEKKIDDINVISKEYQEDESKKELVGQIIQETDILKEGYKEKIEDISLKDQQIKEKELMDKMEEDKTEALIVDESIIKGAEIKEAMKEVKESALVISDTKPGKETLKEEKDTVEDSILKEQSIPCSKLKEEKDENDIEPYDRQKEDRQPIVSEMKKELEAEEKTVKERAETLLEQKTVDSKVDKDECQTTHIEKKADVISDLKDEKVLVTSKEKIDTVTSLEGEKEISTVETSKEEKSLISPKLDEQEDDVCLKEKEKSIVKIEDEKKVDLPEIHSATIHEKVSVDTVPKQESVHREITDEIGTLAANIDEEVTLEETEEKDARTKLSSIKMEFKEQPSESPKIKDQGVEITVDRKEIEFISADDKDVDKKEDLKQVDSQEIKESQLEPLSQKDDIQKLKIDEKLPEQEKLISSEILRPIDEIKTTELSSEVLGDIEISKVAEKDLIKKEEIKISDILGETRLEPERELKEKLVGAKKELEVSIESKIPDITEESLCPIKDKIKDICTELPEGAKLSEAKTAEERTDNEILDTSKLVITESKKETKEESDEILTDKSKGLTDKILEKKETGKDVEVEPKDKKEEEIKPEDRKHVEVKPKDKKEEETKPEDGKDVEVQPKDKKEEETKSEDRKDVEVQPKDIKEEETKPEVKKEEESKPEVKKDEESKPEVKKEEESKPEEKKDVAVHPKDKKEEETKPEDGKDVEVQLKDKKEEEIKPEDRKDVEVQPKDKKEEETKPEDGKDVEVQPKDKKEEETKPEDGKDVEVQPKDKKEEETKPEDGQDVEVQPKDKKEEETKPEDGKDVEVQPKDKKEEETKPEDGQDVEVQPKDKKEEETKPEDGKDVEVQPKDKKEEESKPEVKKEEESTPEKKQDEEVTLEVKEEEETKTEDRKDVEVKPKDKKEEETKSEDRKDVEVQPKDKKEEETKPEDRKAVEVQPEDKKEEETQPEDGKDIEVKPEGKKEEESRPEVKKEKESKPEIKKDEESKPEVKKEEESKPEEKKDVEVYPKDKKEEETKPEDGKDVEVKPKDKKEEESKPEVKKEEESKPEAKKEKESKPEEKQEKESKPEEKQDEEVKLEVQKEGETKTEDGKDVEVKPKDKKEEEIKPEDRKDLEVKPKDKTEEETKPEDGKDVEVMPKDRKDVEGKLKDTKEDEPKPEDGKAAKLKPEDKKTEVKSEEKKEPEYKTEGKKAEITAEEGDAEIMPGEKEEQVIKPEKKDEIRPEGKDEEIKPEEKEEIIIKTEDKKEVITLEEKEAETQLKTRMKEELQLEDNYGKIKPEDKKAAEIEFEETIESELKTEEKKADMRPEEVMEIGSKPEDKKETEYKPEDKKELKTKSAAKQEEGIRPEDKIGEKKPEGKEPEPKPNDKDLLKMEDKIEPETEIEVKKETVIIKTEDKKELGTKPEDKRETNTLKMEDMQESETKLEDKTEIDILKKEDKKEVESKAEDKKDTDTIKMEDKKETDILKLEGKKEPETKIEDKEDIVISKTEDKKELETKSEDKESKTKIEDKKEGDTLKMEDKKEGESLKVEDKKELDTELDDKQQEPKTEVKRESDIRPEDKKEIDISDMDDKKEPETKPDVTKEPEVKSDEKKEPGLSTQDKVSEIKVVDKKEPKMKLEEKEKAEIETKGKEPETKSEEMKEHHTKPEDEKDSGFKSEDKEKLKSKPVDEKLTEIKPGEITVEEDEKELETIPSDKKKSETTSEEKKDEHLKVADKEELGSKSEDKKEEEIKSEDREEPKATSEDKKDEETKADSKKDTVSSEEKASEYTLLEGQLRIGTKISEESKLLLETIDKEINGFEQKISVDTKHFEEKKYEESDHIKDKGIVESKLLVHRKEAECKLVEGQEGKKFEIIQEKKEGELMSSEEKKVADPKLLVEVVAGKASAIAQEETFREFKMSEEKESKEIDVKSKDVIEVESTHIADKCSIDIKSMETELPIDKKDMEMKSSERTHDKECKVLQDDTESKPSEKDDKKVLGSTVLDDKKEIASKSLEESKIIDSKVVEIQSILDKKEIQASKEVVHLEGSQPLEYRKDTDVLLLLGKETTELPKDISQKELEILKHDFGSELLIEDKTGDKDLSKFTEEKEDLEYSKLALKSSELLTGIKESEILQEENITQSESPQEKPEKQVQKQDEALKVSEPKDSEVNVLDRKKEVEVERRDLAQEKIKEEEIVEKEVKQEMQITSSKDLADELKHGAEKIEPKGTVSDSIKKSDLEFTDSKLSKMETIEKEEEEKESKLEIFDKKEGIVSEDSQMKIKTEDKMSSDEIKAPEHSVMKSEESNIITFPPQKEESVILTEITQTERRDSLKMTSQKKEETSSELSKAEEEKSSEVMTSKPSVSSEITTLEKSIEPDISKVEKGSIDSSIKEDKTEKGHLCELGQKTESAQIMKRELGEEVKIQSFLLESVDATTSISHQDIPQKSEVSSTKVNGFAAKDVDTIISSKDKAESKMLESEEVIKTQVLETTTQISTISISAKGEKDTANADLKSKLKDEKQVSVTDEDKTDKPRESSQDITSLSSEELAGQSASMVKLEEKDPIDSSKFANGTKQGETTDQILSEEKLRELYTKPTLVMEQSTITNGKLEGTSKQEFDKGCLTLKTDLKDLDEEGSAATVTKTVITKEIISEQKHTNGFQKKEGYCEKTETKYFTDISMPGVLKSQEVKEQSSKEISDKIEQICKVEKIITEKHEIESVKDVSVVKSKLISEVSPALNGSTLHKDSECSSSLKIEKLINGSQIDSKDKKDSVIESKTSETCKTEETKLTSDLGQHIESRSREIVETKEKDIKKEVEPKESVEIFSSHKIIESKEESIPQTSALKDISMIKDMTASFISTERWTGRTVETPEGRVTPSSETSAMWRESDDDLPASPLSTTSHVHSPPPAMFSSVYGQRFEDDDSDVDFETAVREHTEVRGQSLAPKESVLGQTFDLKDQALSKESAHSIPSKEALEPLQVLDLKKPTSGHSVDPKATESVSSTSQQLSSKDPIEKWDKPLGLPPPPNGKNYWSPFKEWGRPLYLPSPAPPPNDNDNEDTSGSAKTTPKKVAKMNEENNRYASNIVIGKEANNKNRRSDSPVKKGMRDGKKSGMGHIYLDLSYVPHHGNSHYANVEFFKRVRARYYVFSGTEPSKEVFNALLEAKQTWEDKDLEVTIIPTYDTDTLGYWIAENEETLSKYKIDLSPSASRCTINLQDHDTSCSAYRLEF